MTVQLKAVAESQGQWSNTANVLKQKYERARLLIFALSTTAALLAAVASQHEDTLRRSLAAASTVCMALVAFLTARLLGAKQSQSWARARATSEALKREGYKRAAEAAPYDTAATADGLLLAEKQKIEKDVDDLLDLREATGSSSLPTVPIMPKDYIAKRVEGAIKWYDPKAEQARITARKWRRLEFILALATTVITAVIGQLPKHVIASVNFDFVALTAVLTTLSGAIIAFIEASRYDYLVHSYRAAARRLRDELSNPPPDPPSKADWSAFVARCEGILQEENGSWTAKFK
jgi:hypothetical protein